MSETTPPPARRVPQPSKDLATVCRLLAVHSPLWDNGPRPGIVMRPLPNGAARVKLLLDSADYNACRKLDTVSGTCEAEVSLTVYDALSEEDRDQLRADFVAIHGVDAMWAEWPARPKLGIPVVGSVGDKISVDERIILTKDAVADLTQTEVAANREPAAPASSIAAMADVMADEEAADEPDPIHPNGTPASELTGQEDD